MVCVFRFAERWFRFGAVLVYLQRLDLCCCGWNVHLAGLGTLRMCCHRLTGVNRTLAAGVHVGCLRRCYDIALLFSQATKTGLTCCGDDVLHHCVTFGKLRLSCSPVLCAPAL